MHGEKGWITKGGTPKGKCSGDSAAGALDAATHGKWSGKYFSSLGDIEVTSIVGVKPPSSDFWELFVNGKPASTGVCEVKLHAGRSCCSRSPSESDCTSARAALTAIAIACAVATAGCGLGAGKATSGVATLTVTRDFGTGPVGSVTEKSIPGSQTVMRMLERSFKVTTRYSGGFVESIDGHAGGSSRLDWFYYVNGIEASLGAAGTSVHYGDRIWWDLHDWTATDSIPAVVGSFPEPFIHGINGRRFPVTIECATDAGMACKRVTSELDSIGVKVASQAIGGGLGL